ncbi:MAG: carboxypeptidase regulatory-like domain-containing protein [Planctomycetota bacterium]
MGRVVVRRCWRVAVVVGLLGGLGAGAAADSGGGGISGGGAVVLDPQAAWREGCGADHLTQQWSMAPGEGGAMVFRTLEPGHAAVWNFPARLDLDPERTPILSMTYRATGLRASEPRRTVLAFYGGKPNHFTAVHQRHLHSDGQTHTLRLDLREELAEKGVTAAALVRMDVRVHAGEGAGEFELIDLRFEPAPDSPGSAGTLAAGEPRPVRVRVADAAGEPVAGATVTLDPHLREGHGRREVATDADGRAEVSPAATHSAARGTLEVGAPGMTSVVFRELKEVEAGQTLTATLYPTATYGGVVVNEDGEPIAGAVGEVWIDGIERPNGLGRPSVPALRRVRVTTDEEGRWRSSPLPDTANFALRVRWMHPDYLSDRWGGQFSGELAMAELREGTARSTMPRGVVVRGRVFDQDGQPLAGAHVAQGDDRFPSNAPPATRTDAEGVFVFPHTEPGRLVLTVTAKGHAPQLVQTNVAAGTASDGFEPIEFRLAEAAVFRFRVVDADGEPIAGASVCPDTWKGFRTIPGRVRTDANGEATWHGPHDPVEFDVFASRDHGQKRGLTFSPSKSDGGVHVVTLGEPLRITATVTDAATGEPVKAFTPVVGILWQNDGQRSPHYQRSDATPVADADGRWEQRFGHPYPFRVIRIEAQGYAPAVSEPIAEDAGHVELSFALEPAEPLAGTLVDASGRPVAGADVFLSLGTSNLYIRNGRVEQNRNHPRVTTDARGVFSFPPQSDGEAFMLVVLHERGYAEMDAEAWASAVDDGSRVVLRPWSRITGRLIVGDQPGAGQQLAVSMHSRHDENPRPPYHDIKTTADADGRFVLDRVPPGEGQVAHYVQVGERRWSYDQAEKFDLEPGASLDVVIGGGGRPVVGRFTWPEDAEDRGFDAGHNSFSTHIDREAYTAAAEELRERLMPEGFEAFSPEQRQAFLETDEGRAMQQAFNDLSEKFHGQQKRHALRVQPDGTFRIDNVKPGTYDLSLQLHEPPAGNQCGWGDPTGNFNQTVTVPPLPEGVDYLGEPLDLGTLTITPVTPPLQVGDAVPDFSLPVLPATREPQADAGDAENQGDARQEIDLSALPTFDSASLTGRLTLVYFGASWCGPCHAEAPHLTATWDALGEDPRFAMLSVSLDQTPSAAVRYARDKGYGWPQLFSEGAFRSPAVAGFGVRAIPSVWLIGPDGRVLAKDLRGAAILPAARDALRSVTTTAAR